jgi:hypothetical protein
LQDPPKFTPTGTFWFENMPSDNPASSVDAAFDHSKKRNNNKKQSTLLTHTEQGDKMGQIFNIGAIFSLLGFCFNKISRPMWLLLSRKGYAFVKILVGLCTPRDYLLTKNIWSPWRQNEAVRLFTGFGASFKLFTFVKFMSEGS